LRVDRLLVTALILATGLAAHADSRAQSVAPTRIDARVIVKL
jgi:hypothetical protein